MKFIFENNSTLDRGLRRRLDVGSSFIESVLIYLVNGERIGYDQCAGDGGETNNCI